MTDKPIFIYVLVRSWNAYEYFDKCIDSVLNQTYKKFKILFVDDASGYNFNQKRHIRSKLSGHVCVFNKTRKYSVENAYCLLHKYAIIKNSITIILDGDDWLPNNKVFSRIAKVYKNNPNINFTYGGCYVWNGKKLSDLYKNRIIPYSNTYYSKKTIAKKEFRLDPFRIFHLMTFKNNAFKKIKKPSFMENQTTWLKYSFDLATYLPLLEISNGKFIKINEPLCVYNQASDKTNTKLNLFEFIREDLIIRKKKICKIKKM